VIKVSYNVCAKHKVRNVSTTKQTVDDSRLHQCSTAQSISSSVTDYVAAIVQNLLQIINIRSLLT